MRKNRRGRKGGREKCGWGREEKREKGELGEGVGRATSMGCSLTRTKSHLKPESESVHCRYIRPHSQHMPKQRRLENRHHVTGQLQGVGMNT